jgi:hypothetical protein
VLIDGKMVTGNSDATGYMNNGLVATKIGEHWTFERAAGLHEGRVQFRVSRTLFVCHHAQRDFLFLFLLLMFISASL